MSQELGRWHATYTPGDWLLLCGPAAAVVLEPADDSWSDLVETLWDEVASATSIGELAARLAWYRIDTMPSFAAFFWSPDGMRSLVRGDVVVVDAVSGDPVATGEGVQTWVEVGLEDLSQVRVELPTSRPAGAFPLPLVIGAAGVSSVFLDASDEAQVVPQHDEVAGEAETRWVPIPELMDTDVEAAEPVEPGRPEAPLEAPVRTVPAIVCSWGHPNPPAAARCRVCDGLIPVQSPRPVPVPVLAVLRAEDGETAELVDSVLIGRAPARDRARVDDPDTITVTSPLGDISRTHVEVHAEQWQICVTDLHSTNGTVLRSLDETETTLPPGQTVPVPLGTSLVLAPGISVLIDFPQ